MKKPIYIKSPETPHKIFIVAAVVILSFVVGFIVMLKKKPLSIDDTQYQINDIPSKPSENASVKHEPAQDKIHIPSPPLESVSELTQKEVKIIPPTPASPKPPHENYSIKVDDIQTLRHPTKTGAVNVTIRCKFFDNSKNDKILAMKSEAHVIAASTDAGELVALPSPLGGLKRGLSTHHSGDFSIELTVPEAARTIEYVDFNVGMLWKKSESSVRWDHPEKSIGQTCSQSGFSFTLIEFNKINNELSVAYKQSVPKGAPSEPHLWALGFINSQIILGNGTPQRGSGLRDMEIRREVFKLADAKAPVAYEIHFVDQIEIEAYPFRLSNLKLPKIEDGRGNISISPNTKTISQGVTFLLQTMETVSTQKGHELAIKVAITLPMDRQFVAASWGISDPIAVDDTGVQLQSLADESNSTSSVDQLSRTARIRLTLPAADASKLTSLKGKYKVFTSELNESIKVAVPLKDEQRALNTAQGALKIVSIARQGDRVIVESTIETSGLANVTWAPATMKAVLGDKLGNSRSPRQGGYKFDQDSKKKYLRTDIFKIDNFEPTYFSLTIVKSGKEEIIPFEFNDIELPAPNKEVKLQLKF